MKEMYEEHHKESNKKKIQEDKTKAKENENYTVKDDYTKVSFMVQDDTQAFRQNARFYNSFVDNYLTEF